MKRISILLIMLTAMLAPLAMNGQNSNITWNFNSNVTNGTMECGSSFTMSGSVSERNARDYYYVLTSSSADCPITVTCNSLTGAGSSNPNIYIYEGSGTSGTLLQTWTTSNHSATATSTAGVITIRLKRNQTQSNRQVSYNLTINQDCCSTCPTPTNVTVPSNSIGATSAVVNWSGETDSYNIRYKLASAAPTTTTYGFEDGMGDWTTIDADGDGFNWVLGSATDGVYTYGENLVGYGYNSSTDLIVSGSYRNTGSNSGVALTPDNYLVSKQITLGGTISFYAHGSNSNYVAEHFGVFVSTNSNNNPNDFVKVSEWTATTTSYTPYSADLSAYGGQGYVAIRHFNCTDMFLLSVDDITIEEPAWTTTTSNTTSVTLNNLTPNTEYVVQVQGNCGNGDLSQWSQTVNFTTSNVATYNVSAGTISNGDITFSIDGGYNWSNSLSGVMAGETVVISVEPDQGFTLQGAPTVTPASGTAPTVTGSGNLYSFEMPASDVTVNATFNCTTPADPTFSVAGGTYTSAQNVTISCATAGATIYYTTDGSTPTNGSTPYTGAITINSTTTLKAIAYIGTCTSNVTTATYTMDLPTYTVTCATGLTGGSLSASPISAVEGTTITVTVTTDSGYFLGTITATDGNSNDVPVTVSGNQGTFTMPASNVTVTATFTQGFQVTLNQTPNGTISADQTTNLQPNDVVTLTATPDNDCVFLAWYVFKDGNPRDVIAVVNNSWFFMPSSNVTVQAVFVTEEEHEQTVGGGTNTNGNLPTNVYYNYSLTQQIYTAAEIGYNGRITAIAFKANGTATRALDIYMAHTSKTAFTSTTDWQTMGPSFLVYSHDSGDISFSSSDWTTITLDTPFEYDGTSNLNICVVDRTGSWVDNITFNTYSTSANRAMYVRDDNTDYSQGVNASGISNYTGTQSTVNNQIKFTIKVPGSAESLTISMDISKGFRYEENHGPSHADKLDVVGVDLENDITITAPTNFEVCLTEDGTYTSSLTIPRETSKSNRAATTWDFDSSEIGLGDWTANDADGDGYNWEHSSVSTNFTAYDESAGCVVSASFINNVGALTPNNWLVSPQVELGGTFSLYAVAQDQAWPQEHFGIYVSTTGTNPSDFTMLGEWTLAAGDWKQYSVDLRAFAGQNGYIAVRHFNCTDKYYIKVDHFVLDTDAHIEIEMPVTITPATVYVRMKAGLSAGNYSGTLTASAGSGTNVNSSVNLRGEVIASNTWSTAVTTLAAATPGYSESGTNITISNENGLAWLISTVNGLNGQSATLSGKTITLTADVDMSDHVWVPIGTTERPFTCTFDGNGHFIDGINSSLTSGNMGLFGKTENATIMNLIVNADFEGGTALGSLVGEMAGGTISNVEGAGTLTGGASTTSMGGLVGNKTSGTIHSSFAVNTITSNNATTHVGGLVGNNAGNLLNSYANTTISGSGQIGGLVGKNNGTVENCYAVIGSQTFPAFAYENAEGGTIQYCYADNANNYVNTTVSGTPTPVLQGHGTYSATQNTHTYGYMYWDNTVTLASGQNNNNKHVVDTIKYANNQIDRWPGLLSTLEHWVDSINGNTSLFPSITFTKWLRPTTKHINDDLPVLCFPSDNCMLTIDSEGKALRYGPFDGNSHSTYINRGPVEGALGNQGFGQEPLGSSGDDNNGVDDLLEENPSGYLFIYDNAINVERVPNANLSVFINEDVVFKQASSAGAFINTQVGVSFDNSCGTATDFFENTLKYDWHMLSTPLANAPLGISYSDAAINPWTDNDMSNQVTGVANSYMPDGTGNVDHWDLYSFYEPEYHWINLKRNSASHHHFDEPYDLINYTNESTFTPGKGYMVAIDKDSYLCNKGTLNGPTNPVSIMLTMQSQAPGTEERGYNLLGNPYQAYLDVNGFLGRNNLEDYWVYIAESDNYIAGNTSASKNPALPSATLHPHQGFFVMANSDEQVVNFDYSTMALTTPVAESYYRGGKVDYPLVNLFATGENGKKDLAVIEFNRPKFGGSKKMRAINNANFELAANMGSQRYSILFTKEGVDRVPVHFVAKEEGTFTLTWATYNGTFTSLFLVDNKTGVRTDMLHSDHYTFESSPDDYASRFYITFNCIGVEEYIESEGDFAWFDGTNWIVTGEGQLQLVDVLGRVLRTQHLGGDQTRLHLDGYAAGVYMLHLMDGTKSRVQKIVVR